LISRAVDAHEPAHRLRDEIEARSITIRASVAEPGHAPAYQTRIEITQPFVRETHRGQHAGSVVIDQHVALGNQTRQDGTPVIRTQVKRDRALVTIIIGEIPGKPILDRALLAHRIALARCLDLDDLGAKVAEQHRAERTG
jgi:hypothetical protein